MFIGLVVFASGTVVQRTEMVHNKKLSPAKICVDSVHFTEAKHPTYGYNIEVGSFVAWLLIICPLTVYFLNLLFQGKMSESTTSRFPGKCSTN